MAEIFASKTAELEEREVINAQISRKLAGECMVLLENDGVLPIHTKKVELSEIKSIAGVNAILLTAGNRRCTHSAAIHSGRWK